ncbi:flagella basal body P-ring formation protein FlgA [Hydrogenovibrio crunogenus]|uniref:Flagella basal body P-ring formation protein FlgA n=1 Tax=Hydrogenovibrio crunogenus TaxID=39765 RepID=A0A4P7P0L5_9GAMM|nr:flagellar basal body P-ring formation chaperone FlgA [Hydrogenovibrio crunogenus]QBZ83506.1 flagella basal body P-ring formation protein FlgA [Hydrogenovibrio crunogenus]
MRPIKPYIQHFSTALFLLSALLLNSTFAQAENQSLKPESQPLDTLYNMVRSHLKQKTDQKVYNAQIDIREFSRRLQLPKCQEALELEDKAPEKLYGRMTLRVICPSPEWKVYVTATVEGDVPVVITTKAILKQAVIQKEDVKRILVPYQKTKTGALIDIDSAIGMRAKRGLSPNSILTVRQLQPPYLVLEDNNVTIITYIGNIKVESVGKALKDGVKNQQVPVENLSSKKIIKGIVIAPNTVLVP